MPEGDTIAWTANRLRPVLEGAVLAEVHSPRNPRWRERLAGRRVRLIDTYGKHLFVHIEGELVLHSHLGMSGSWYVARERRAWRDAWLVLGVDDAWVLQQRGPTLELLTEGRRRFDQRLAGLGPDVLAPSFDAQRFLARLRAYDQTRAVGDALLDQRNLAGIGNIWKAEGCWDAGVDPRKTVAEVSNAQALSIVAGVRPRMLRSASQGPRAIRPQVYRRTGMPCARCGGRIAAVGQGDDNRVTYWCPGCQR